MRAHTPDGGPAFPAGEAPAHPDTCGMTLRDYFAAQTIAGLAWEGEGHAAELSRRAYLFADAMIAERAKASA